MNGYLLSALAAATLVVLAHIGLFWWFLVRKPKGNSGDDEEGGPPSPDGK